MRSEIISLVLSLLLFSCTPQIKDIIKIDGSSTVYPMSEAMAEEYLTRSDIDHKMKVTVGSSGTGGGFKKFCRGEIDITGASRPITSKEINQCQAKNITYFELEIAYDATVVVVHKKNKLNQISLEQLKKIWEPSAQGLRTYWNQIDPSWPDHKILLYGAGSDSGTFDYFTEVIVGKAKSSRGDYTASEDDNTIVAGVSSDEKALGYLPFSYYQENRDKLKALAVRNKEGEYVLPNVENVEKGKYNPLSRPLYIYISQKSYQDPRVKQFIKFYMDHIRSISAEVQYIPLPELVFQKNLNHLSEVK